MKKTTVLISVAVLVFALVIPSFCAVSAAQINVWSGFLAQTYGGGDGSEASPYLINTAEQLACLADRVNTGTSYEGKYFRLTSDIYLNGNISAWNTWIITPPKNVWTPIGTKKGGFKLPFSGVFDGYGHSVKGVYINSENEDYKGLFGYSDGTIMNLGVTDSYIYGGTCVGGVCGSGTVINCYNSGYIRGNNRVGGVCGEGTVRNSYNTGYIEGVQSIGGVCGENRGTLADCYNTGSVNGRTRTGGVCGFNYYFTVMNCYNAGKVKGSSSVGEICGESAGYINNCYYLLGNAVDGRDTLQFGVGSKDLGKTVKDAIGSSAGLSAAEMQKKESYKGWDFNNVWTMRSGMKYPQLIVILSKATGGDSRVWDGTTAGKFDSGNGTKNSPYIIKSAAQLAYFARSVNSGMSYSGKYIKLATDIILNDNSKLFWTLKAFPWTPVGMYKTEKLKAPFDGVFDGGGHTISGIYINSDKNYQGLFGYVTGTVMNVNIKNSYISGLSYIGSVCGLCTGTVTGCENDGSVSGSEYIGGVCGKGQAAECRNNGYVNGNNCVGGITGYGSAVFCINTGTVRGGTRTGGIAGLCPESGEIKYCRNSGSINAVSGVGGIVGICENTAASCYNYGAVTGNDTAGGICGDGGTSGCYSTGNVTAELSVGAICGQGFTVNSYYLKGSASDTGKSEVNAVGSAIKGQTVDDRAGFASALTAEKLRDKASFEGWDFKNVWIIASGYEYPQFIRYSGVSSSRPAGSWDGSAARSFESGNGTASDPYIIKTAAQLAYFAASVNSGSSYSGKYISLGNDIVLNDTSVKGWTLAAVRWTPIGSVGRLSVKAPFAGTFDGKGYKISGLFTEGYGKSLGLFGYSTGKIINVTLENSFINGYFSYPVTTEKLPESSVLTNLSFVTCTGGICGVNSGTVKGCAVISAVSGGVFTGGICGAGDADSCFNAGSVSGFGYTGGISGAGSTVYCYSSGSVNGGIHTGGIVATTVSGVKNSYNCGGVSGMLYTGGLCGSGNAGYCYNTGKVKGASYTGAVTGIGKQTEKCKFLSYSASDISGKECTAVGYENSFDIPADTGGLAEAAMKTQNAYSGWDFNSVWTFKAARDYEYPTLINVTHYEPHECVPGEWVTEQEPDCCNTGSKFVCCSICGSLLEERVIPVDADNHSFGEWYVKTEPLSKTDGLRERKCLRCGTSETEVIPKLGNKDLVKMLILIAVAVVILAALGVVMIIVIKNTSKPQKPPEIKEKKE